MKKLGLLICVVLTSLGCIASVAAAQRVSNASGACTRATPLAFGKKSTDGRLLGVSIPARRGRVWALPLGVLPVTTGGDLKIVWRATGRGPLHVTFKSPTGERKPFVGPVTHDQTSNFARPGDEWGTIFQFDAPGCWTIGLSRRGTAATIRVTVA